ncbi:unnamed protein product [Menidia menidia]|uniref:peptidyl-tRNA hydrolase n=1 Tax=Menidia menidia TaxID=238744 RepID=A0A8S4B1W5_9TELE|nr:unnamed protein product [Menidia menidia]
MAASGAGSPGRLVQYVVVRSDLVHALSWPLGAVLAQACHAATAAVHVHYGDPDTQRYLADLDSMHKVVLASLEQAGVSHKLWVEQPENIPTCLALKPYPREAVQPLLRKGLSESLEQAGVSHKLWVEQPENIPTCLALKPYPREAVQPLLRKFKLFK